MLDYIIEMIIFTYYSLYIGLHGCSNICVVDVVVVVMYNLYITMKHNSWTIMTIVY